SVRRIEAPAWDDINENYTEDASRAFSRLIAADRPTDGSLVILHGPPGTGKTYALRSLMRAWKEWCDPQFLVDPLPALSDTGADFAGGVLNAEPADPRMRHGEDRYRLVILEDAGEVLASDARATAGTALTRLLNITDGLLADGFRTIVAVTTNEPVGRLHPALRRPGRRLAEIEFGPLPVERANRWLETKGSPCRVTSPTPLADLYALAREDGTGENAGPSFGFANASA
ncbi:MAG: ATP-binding protein, partial [Thermoleophilaceae bacterium]|nr:ATP-binding protein [Thermoleophilaceae bacterium]